MTYQDSTAVDELARLVESQEIVQVGAPLVVALKKQLRASGRRIHEIHFGLPYEIHQAVSLLAFDNPVLVLPADLDGLQPVIDWLRKQRTSLHIILAGAPAPSQLQAVA